ncbi:MAG: hypothetical protein AAGN35_11955 [Bacteroidota bacterium]
MANQYDHIFRENFHAVFISFFKRKLGIEFAVVEDLSPKLQKTNREVDFVKRVTTVDKREFILHVEFQTTNDPKMVYRMNVYQALLLEKYKLPVYSTVLYMGSAPVNMRSELRPEEVMHGFELINLPGMDFNEFLSAKTPEEVIFAILADHGEADPSTVMQLIVNRLVEVENNRTEQMKFLQQLRVISRIRNLEYTLTEKTKNMPLYLDLKEDSFYQKGVITGRAEGIAKGEAKGEAKAKLEMIIKLLRADALPIEKLAQMVDLPADRIRAIKKEHKL